MAYKNFNHMNKEFIPYKQALELKELGFDEPCLNYYHNGKISQTCKEYLSVKTLNDDCVLAPLYQQAFRWFREKYQLIHSILKVGSDWHKTLEFTYSIDGAIYIKECCTKTYEEAELACLKKLIEIAKIKSNEN